MGKYDELGRYLRKVSAQEVRLTFDQVQALVPGGLPPSAFNYPAWWSNELNGRHVQALAWTEAGLRVSRLDLAGRSVTFTRDSPPR
jgi:YD repeat-containing protein